MRKYVSMLAVQAAAPGLDARWQLYRLLSDPFHPTAEARALLELRAEHVEQAAGGRSLARRFRRRLPALG